MKTKVFLFASILLFAVSSSFAQVIMDELNGSTLGNAIGITYTSTPNGQGAVFSRTFESRIEYPFSMGLPHQGTIEMVVMVTKGYYYDNYTLYDNQSQAYIFNTGPSDVWYLGAMWLTVDNTGGVSLATALSATPTAHNLSASGTAFRFNEWHVISFSYGSQGQFLKVDGQLVASNLSYTETLQACGDWGSNRINPTVGEVHSIFWANNQYDQGFEGVLDRFRASDLQQDWALCTNPFGPGTISGPTTVYAGQNSVIYTVPPIGNATSYVWTLPSGATGTSTTNSINVNFGTSAVSGVISVKGHNSCGDGATSTLAITVNSPSNLMVTAPNGGETWFKGSNYTITWSSTNVIGAIQIDLYKGSRNVLQLAANAPNTGIYPFSPTGSIVEGSDYRIGISAMSGYVADFSNSNFTIDLLNKPDWIYPCENYIPGSYNGRSFFYDNDHLGEDVKLTEGEPIHAIGSGIVRKYGPANGYGELVVVIEHQLQENLGFINAYDNTVNTSYLLSIYGHLRKSAQRNGTEIRLKEGDIVRTGDLIGYVNDGAHNGDGNEHLHMGIRLSKMSLAMETDPTAWYRGYEGNSQYGRDFAAFSKVIQVLNSEENKSIRVIYPNGGETLISGQNYLISWISQNVTGNVQIDLYKGTSMLIQLAASAPNTGSYPFSPTGLISEGTDYRIGISAIGGSVPDFSNSYFTIKKIDNLPPPMLKSPINAGTLSGPPYIFEWESNSGAGAYHLKISSNVYFLNPEYNDYSISGLSSNLPVNLELDFNRTYYWQMRTLDASGNHWGDWSPYQSFIVNNSTSKVPIDDYPDSYKVSSVCDRWVGNNYCDGNCNQDEWGFYRRECTSFVAWRVNRDFGFTEVTSVDPFRNNSVFGKVPPNDRHRLGDALYWADALEEMHFKVDKNPLAGDIAWFNYGHVAYVSSVNNDGSVNIEQYNNYSSCEDRGLYSYQVNQRAHKYIHLRDGLGGSFVDQQIALPIEVYPNPAHNDLIISTAQGSITSPAQYEVFDFLGQSLLNGKVNQPIQSLDISRLTNGIYFLLIKSGNVQLKKVKFVKQ